jgi:methylphosphotriester-DNA--protein-cysteine methyltransferase
MKQHHNLTSIQLHPLIRTGKILFAGNIKLKIYGTLHCSSGKRMKKESRVFFASEQEAIQNGFRPCGHCMREVYLKWKNGANSNKIPRVQS